MISLFISQPMADKTEEEILEERRVAVETVEDLLGEKVNVIDSYLTDDDLSPAEMLGKSIQLMAGAEIIYFCPGWDKARGCKIEHTVAKEYDFASIIER